MSTRSARPMTAPQEPAAAASVVFVCTGNICRSAMAERMAAAALADLPVTVDSAGISDEEHGNPMDPRAARVLAAHGFPTDGHTARQLTPAWLASRDLAVVMTERHRLATERLLAAVPEADRPEVRMLRSFDPAVVGGPGAPATGASGADPATASGADLDVIDPWYGPPEGFEDTYAMIAAALPGIRAHLETVIGS